MIICAGQKIFKSFEKKNNMSSFTLTSNGIAQINNGSTNPTTLQIIAIKEVPYLSGQPSLHKILLSDGLHSCAGILAIQLSNAVQSGELKQFTVISVTDVMVNDVGKRALVIVLNENIATKQMPPSKGSPTKITAHNIFFLCEKLWHDRLFPFLPFLAVTTVDDFSQPYLKK